MRIQVVAAALATVLAAGCESKQATVGKEAPIAPAASAPAPAKAPPKSTAGAPLTDITARTSLGAVRAAFNAHRGEARFLTLLSPT